MCDDTGRKQRQRVQQTDHLSDAPAELVYDTIVHQAAAAIGTSMALVSLVDADRQWFKAWVGISLSKTPLASSFCAHAMRGSGVFVVEDARQDFRFAANPLVTGSPFIRFYAGAPIRLHGLCIGTLCVLDDQPRQHFSALEEAYLVDLADRAAAAFGACRTT